MKGLEVKTWLQDQVVDPWPEATARQLNKLIRHLKKRQQVEKYLHKDPNVTGLEVKKWLQNQAVDPWPESTVVQPKKLIRN